jgi:hypothetical protein
MQIYLVVENVDLGYHAVKGFVDRVAAEEVCQGMNTEYQRDMVEGLIQHCGYTLENAWAYAGKRTHYEVETVEVEE